MTRNWEQIYSLKIGVKDRITRYAVTTASTHDSKIDLSRRGIPVYRDKGYFGVKPKGFDATMTKALRSFKLGIYSILRNRRISRKRALVEYPFSIIKRVFHFSHLGHFV